MFGCAIKIGDLYDKIITTIMPAHFAFSIVIHTVHLSKYRSQQLCAIFVYYGDNYFITKYTFQLVLRPSLQPTAVHLITSIRACPVSIAS